MARAKKGAAGSLAATPQTAATGAPADAGAPAPNPDQSVNEAAQVPGGAVDQSQTAAASETVQMPGAAPAVVVTAAEPETAPEPEAIGHSDSEAVLLARYEGEIISVRSHKSRRRAGLAFGPEAVEIDTDELTDGQMLQLLGDDQLEVTIVE